MLVSNIYSNISAIDCRRVNFKGLGNKLSTEETPIIFSNGLRLNTNECLKNCLSFKVNNKTALFLTDLTKGSEILTNYETPALTGKLTEIDSPITGNYIYHSPIGDTEYNVLTLKSIGSFYCLSSTNSSEFNADNVFRFIFQPDDSVVVQSVKTKYYLTATYEGIGGLTLQPRIYNQLSSENVFVDAQRFDYSLGPNCISLFQIDDYAQFSGRLMPRFDTAVMKLQTGVYGLSSLFFLTSSTPFPKEAVFYFLSYEKIKDISNKIPDSFLVKYKVNPIDELQVMKYDTEVAQQTYTQNYLGIFPYQYPIMSGNTATYDLAIHGLKNYQTPEYNYSFGFEYIPGQSGVRRKYENIFTGTNQDKGTDGVYLNFNSNTIEIDFPPDVETPFYFGPTSERVPLSSSGLIEDGAIPGEVPFTADKIYIKHQDYSEKIPDSSQPASIPRYSNTWLCAWLSGSMDGDKVWMDRYYNPAYYSIEQALTAKVMAYNDKLYPELNYTYDVPSQMYLEPGVLYKYFHTGKNNRLNYINHLSANSILNITDWSGSPLVDTSPLNGEGIVYFKNDKTLNKDYINLDGTNHVLFPAKTNLLTNSKLTVSMWLNVDNWNRIEGSQIFGNYSESGFGLINDSGLTTPIITLVDNSNNQVYNLNYRFKTLVSFNLPSDKNTTFTSNKIIKRLPDYSYWIFDTSTKNGVKYDVNNQILKVINFNNQPNLINISQISQIEIDSKENIYLFDNSTGSYIQFDTFGNFIQTNTLQNTYSIQLDLNDNIVSCYGNYSAVDNDNNIWEIVGGNLYKNKKIFGNIGYVQQMSVDASNNLWLLNDQDTVTKIDIKNNKVLFSLRIGKKSNLPLDPCFDYTKKTRFMSFIRVPKDVNSKTCTPDKNFTEDRLVLVSLLDGLIYTINSDGAVLTKTIIPNNITSSSNPNLLSYGDFTGYDYLRKYTIINKTLSWRIKISNPNGTNGQVLTLPYSLNYVLSSWVKPDQGGWHNFALSFDSVNGHVAAYVDSYKVSEINFEPNVYQLYYNYRTSLLLGCQSIKNTTLNDLIQIDDGYKFVGKVAELRVYNKSLTDGEISQMYYSSQYGNDDKKLLWNMSVGERNYIEKIKHWFKFQMPGSKSKYYNINIYNLPVNNEVKALIEDGIRKNVAKIAPAETSLYKINWS